MVLGSPADRNEESVDLERALGSRFVLNRHGAELLLKMQLLYGAVEHELDVIALFQQRNRGFLTSERVAAVNQIYLFRNVREIERVLKSGVAAANDRNCLFAVKRAVAGRAV